MPEYFYVTADDGHRIAALHWPPDAGQALGVVHWLHGMAEHSARYAPLAAFLNSHGWHLVTHDHRGHGKSVTDEQDRGHYADKDGWEKVLSDAASVQAHIHQKMPGLPLILGGHSMGSFIALAYAERYGDSLTGLILSGSNWHPQWYYQVMRLPILLEKLRLGTRGVSALIHHLSFGQFARDIPNAHTAFDWLSADMDAVMAYVADPWCGHDCTTGLWADLVGGLIAAHRPSSLARLPGSMPMLMLGGDRDPMSRHGKGMSQLRDAIVRHSKCRPLLHLYADARHEVLNDLCQQQVLDDILSWLKELPEKP